MFVASGFVFITHEKSGSVLNIQHLIPSPCQATFSAGWCHDNHSRYSRSKYWLHVLSSDWLRLDGLVWKTGNPNLSGCFVERRGWAGGWPQTVSLSLSLRLYLFNNKLRFACNVVIETQKKVDHVWFNYANAVFRFDSLWENNNKPDHGYENHTRLHFIGTLKAINRPASSVQHCVFNVDFES